MCRDTLHLKAPGNWINDPNGFIFYKGKYHLFYQYNPSASVWGNMHWGHAVSDDLVHWEHLGIALTPSVYEDWGGCFSGSALEHEGMLNLYYTGIHYIETNEQDSEVYGDRDFISSQLMITSEDGIRFDNIEGKKVVIPGIDNEDQGDRKDTRDPKVWEENGEFYMVLGSTYRGEMGRVLTYKSKDMLNWKYANQFQSEQLGRILECPDVFRAGEDYVFMGSPMYIEEDVGGYKHHAVCMTAEFDSKTCSLTLSQERQYVDYGMDLYAPQTNLDKDGRRVMVAWMRMPKAVEETDKLSWNGMMCIPRVIEAIDGHIYFRVHPNVERCFTQEIEIAKKHVSISQGIPYRLKVTMKEGDILNIGGYRIWKDGNVITTDRSKVFSDITEHRLICSTPELYGECRLDIFVEPNLIEIFVNEGEYVISNTVYGLEDYIEGKVEQAWRFSKSER